MRILAVLTAMILVVGCGDRLPTRGSIYKIATSSALEKAGLPDDAKFRGMDDATFSIAKNAARLDATYDYRLPNGANASKRLSICLKRIARTWKFERAYPTPFAK